MGLNPELLFTLPQDGSELQRLVKLVKEEPLPADAPPLPQADLSESTRGENDGGERIFKHNRTHTRQIRNISDQWIKP